MSFPQQNSVNVTTAADGTATAYLDAADGNGWHGNLLNLIYTKSTFDNGVSWVITAERSGMTLWSEASNSDKTVAPGQATHTTAGVAQTVYDYVPLAGERIKIVITGGGNVKVGNFRAVVA